jgi:prephenate dehydrogenase
VNVAILGLGLIGGSLLRSMSAAGHQVVGYDADPATRTVARAACTQVSGAERWQIAESVGATLDGADLVAVAVPLPAVGGVFEDMCNSGYTGLVTDVTSVKSPVRVLARDRLGVSPRFVGGHPMAGRETSGFGAADPALFDGCAWVLCLDAETDDADWLTLARLVTTLGARVVPAAADEHDRAVAGVSHVPHLLAAALAAGTDPLAATLAAGSFRDGTRVAASAPALVAAMCGGNAGFVGAALDAVLADLAAARAALDAADPIAALQPWLQPGNTARRNWPPRPGDATTLPARRDDLLALGRAGGWITAVSPDGRTVTAVRPAP